MRLLLDTHVYLWSVNNDRALSKKARNLILEANEVYVSSISLWEASIKIKLGKLDADIDKLVLAIEKSGFIELPFTTSHVIATSQLANHHRDPFDRALIAQAIVEPLKILTANRTLEKYTDLVEII